MITPTVPDRARFYASHFKLSFPSLSDPDYTVYRHDGLDVRPRALGWYAHRLYLGTTTPKPETEFGPPRMTPTEIPRVLKDDDLGFFIIDRAGIVRCAQGGPYVSVKDGKQ